MNAMSVSSNFFDIPVLSGGISLDFAGMSRNFNTLRTGQQPSHQPERKVINPVGDGACEEKLFSALAEMKVFTSQVSMHMDDDWRRMLFAQLDRLHDPDQWDKSDDPVNIVSFRTFLRLMFLLMPKLSRYPGLALANEGHLLAQWINGPNRLTVECLQEDNVKIVFTRLLGGTPERGVILARIDRVQDILNPYKPSCWFEAP